MHAGAGAKTTHISIFYYKTRLRDHTYRTGGPDKRTQTLPQIAATLIRHTEQKLEALFSKMILLIVLNFDTNFSATFRKIVQMTVPQNTSFAHTDWVPEGDQIVFHNGLVSFILIQR